MEPSTSHDNIFHLYEKSFDEPSAPDTFQDTFAINRAELPETSHNSNIFQLTEKSFDASSAPDAFEDTHALNKVKLPEIKKKGRPHKRGKEKTAFGFVSKKKKMQSFDDLSSNEKVKILMGFFIQDSSLIQSVINGQYKINLTDIDDNKIQCYLYDYKNLIIHLKTVMHTSAYDHLTGLIETEDRRLKKTIIYTCYKCKKKLGVKESVGCDRCLLWYHSKCVGFKEEHKLLEFWYCYQCKKLK